MKNLRLSSKTVAHKPRAERRGIQLFSICLMLFITQGRQHVFAQQESDPISLRPNFAAGAYQTTLNMVIEQTMEMNGQTVESKNNSTSVLKFTVTPQSDKTAIVQQDVVRLTADLKSGDTEIKFDSAKPSDQSDPLSLSMNAVAKIRRRYRVDTNESIVKSCELLTANDGPASEIPAGLKTAFSEKRLNLEFQQRLNRYPRTPVKRGDGWNAQLVYDLGAGASFVLETTYKYQGQVRVGDKIFHKITAEFPSGTLNLGQQRQKFVKGTAVKIERGTGTFYLNPQTGLFEKSEREIEANADIQFQLNGRERIGKLKFKLVEKSASSPVAP